MQQPSLPAAEQPCATVIDVPEHLRDGTHGFDHRIRCVCKYGMAAEVSVTAYRHRTDRDSTVHVVLTGGGLNVEFRRLAPAAARSIADALNASADEADAQMAEFAAAMKAAGGAA